MVSVQSFVCHMTRPLYHNPVPNTHTRTLQVPASLHDIVHMTLQIYTELLTVDITFHVIIVHVVDNNFFY
jgi:hypothetical protein